MLSPFGGGRGRIIVKQKIKTKIYDSRKKANIHFSLSGAK